MMPTSYNRSRGRWSTRGATVPSSLGLNSGSHADVPAHNFTKNYGMANGLPISDPASGYDASDPWTGRDPRFYKDIAVDVDEKFASSGPHQYVQFYTDGVNRSQINPPSVRDYYAKHH